MSGLFLLLAADDAKAAAIRRFPPELLEGLFRPSHLVPQRICYSHFHLARLPSLFGGTKLGAPRYHAISVSGKTVAVVGSQREFHLGYDGSWKSIRVRGG